MKNAVILSGIAWDTSLQRHHNIANWLYEMGYNVFFVEKITSSKFSFKKLYQKIKIRKKGVKINNPRNNINVISYKFLNPEFKRYNKRLCDKIINELPENIDLVINYLPIETTLYFLDKLNYKKLIYDCVRDFSNWGGYCRSIIEIEKEIISRSNLIFTDSYYLTNKLQNIYKDKNIVQLLPIFEKFQEEICNEKINNKINSMVYFGQLGNHVDADLLKQLSENNITINIIGDISVDLNFKYNYFGFFSDKRKMIEKIIETSDAIIIPYKGNMDGVIPVKTLESLATLKPVFISSFYDSRVLSDYLYVYDSCDDLKEKILNFNDDEYLQRIKKIKKFLADNTSSKQYEKFKQEVNKL